MQQHYYAARVYGDICIRQPLTAEQARQFELLDANEAMELFIVRNGCFVAPSIMPGVLFIDDPEEQTCHLFIKLKGDNTYWSFNHEYQAEAAERAKSILLRSDTLAGLIRACRPINSHTEYLHKVRELMKLMEERDPRRIDCRQVTFIRLEKQFGTYEQNVAVGAVA